MISKYFIQGNLTKDPELKTSVNGKQYCNFTVACNISKDKCYFLNMTMFGETAENFCSWSKKGDMRIFEGEVQQDVYEKDGEKYSTIKLIAHKFYFAGKTQNNDDTKNVLF